MLPLHLCTTTQQLRYNYKTIVRGRKKQVWVAFSPVLVMRYAELFIHLIYLFLVTEYMHWYLESGWGTVCTGLTKRFLWFLSQNRRQFFSIFTENFIEQCIHHFVPLRLPFFRQLQDSIFEKLFLFEQSTIQMPFKVFQEIEMFSIKKIL